MNPLLSRKFMLAILALISLDVLAWNGMISDSLYITGLIATVGAYIVGNVVQSKIPMP